MQKRGRGGEGEGDEKSIKHENGGPLDFLATPNRIYPKPQGPPGFPATLHLSCNLSASCCEQTKSWSWSEVYFSIFIL